MIRAFGPRKTSPSLRVVRQCPSLLSVQTVAQNLQVATNEYHSCRVAVVFYHFIAEILPTPLLAIAHPGLRQWLRQSASNSQLLGLGARPPSASYPAAPSSRATAHHGGVFSATSAYSNTCSCSCPAKYRLSPPLSRRCAAESLVDRGGFIAITEFGKLGLHSRFGQPRAASVRTDKALTPACVFSLLSM